MEPVEAWLLLNSSGLSPARQLTLVRRLGTPVAVFEAADAEIMALEGFNRAHLNKLHNVRDQLDLDKLRARYAELGVRPLPFDDPEYPPLLREISDLPPLLFVQGLMDVRDQLAVAIVGTRKATPYGVTVAQKLARDLARRGFTIVSGMALGIDGAAHEGALEAGGRTIAVMASGSDLTYPARHKQLRARIAASGAVVTEYALGTPPMRELFPARNRIVSGMSMGVIVVDAPDRSGALITARLAGEQGREVFVVPGDIHEPNSAGGHELIRDGATLIRCDDDVVEGLGIMLETVPQRAQRETPQLLGDEKTVFEALGFQPCDVDTLVESTNLAPSGVNVALMLLEVKGLARRFAGGLFARVS